MEPLKEHSLFFLKPLRALRYHCVRLRYYRMNHISGFQTLLPNKIIVQLFIYAAPPYTAAVLNQGFQSGSVHSGLQYIHQTL